MSSSWSKSMWGIISTRSTIKAPSAFGHPLYPSHPGILSSLSCPSLQHHFEEAASSIHGTSCNHLRAAGAAGLTRLRASSRGCQGPSPPYDTPLVPGDLDAMAQRHARAQVICSPLHDTHRVLSKHNGAAICDNSTQSVKPAGFTDCFFSLMGSFVDFTAKNNRTAVAVEATARGLHCRDEDEHRRLWCGNPSAKPQNTLEKGSERALVQTPVPNPRRSTKPRRRLCSKEGEETVAAARERQER